MEENRGATDTNPRRWTSSARLHTIPLPPLQFRASSALARTHVLAAPLFPTLPNLSCTPPSYLLNHKSKGATPICAMLPCCVDKNEALVPKLLSSHRVELLTIWGNNFLCSRAIGEGPHFNRAQPQPSTVASFSFFGTVFLLLKAPGQLHHFLPLRFCSRLTGPQKQRPVSPQFSHQGHGRFCDLVFSFSVALAVSRLAVFIRVNL